MGFKEEVSELCHTIHLFENNVKELKEQLFDIKFVTRKLLWNHVVGGSYKAADKNQIKNYFAKHGFKIKTNQIQLMLHTYSSGKDGTLSENDLWQIFKPMHMKAVEDILRVREKKQVVSGCHQTHYKVADLLVEIMRKTVQFLIVAQKMKWNIVGCQAQPFEVKPLDAGHFQMYIHEYAPGLQKKDVQIVLNHIMRTQLWHDKTLKEYFIPYGYQGNDCNPNYCREKEQTLEMEGVELMKYHWETIKYVEGGAKKKFPIYLLETADSVFSTK